MNMSNMSYCRFENTLAGLQDCYDVGMEDDLAGVEDAARKAMIRLCCDIAIDYGYAIQRDISDNT